MYGVVCTFIYMYITSDHFIYLYVGITGVIRGVWLSSHHVSASYWRSMPSQTCMLRSEVLHLATKPLMNSKWILLKGACAGVHTVMLCRVAEHSSRYTKLAHLQGQELSAVCGVWSAANSELTLDSWDEPEIRVWFMSSWLATVDYWLFRPCVCTCTCILCLCTYTQ